VAAPDFIKGRAYKLPGTRVVRQAAHDRFVSIDITVSDFKVETAIRISANPCLVVDSRALAAEIGKGHEVSGVAFLALGESEIFHGSSSQPEKRFKTLSVYLIIVTIYKYPPHLYLPLPLRSSII
jgi:hypothetical protein